VGKWNIEKLSLPLAVKWSISRGDVLAKENFIISFKDGEFEGKGEVAFVTHGEVTPRQIEEEFVEFTTKYRGEMNGLEDLVEKLEESQLSSNLRFAIESSYVHFLAELMEDRPSRVLGVREVNKISTSFSIPHMDHKKVTEFIREKNLSRFSSLKIKIKSEDDIDLIRAIGAEYLGPLRIDGNECFTDEKIASDFLNQLEDQNIQFIEQPMKHSAFDEAIKLKESTKYMLIADESLQDGAVVDDLQHAFHGVNVKLQKAGGYIKALNQLREARLLGLKTMLGCMVETSLGISSAMNIGHGIDFFDLDGFLLLEKDPFGLIYEENGFLYYDYSH